MARTLQEYHFERKVRETFICKSEEEARVKLTDWYGEDASEFVLTNVVTFKEQK